MGMWLYNDRGRVSVIDLSDLPGSPHFRPAVVQLSGYSSAGSDPDYMAHAYIMQSVSGRQANDQVDKTGTGTLYYSVFGEDHVPLQLDALIAVPTTGDRSGTDAGGAATYSTSGYKQIQKFLDNNIHIGPSISLSDTMKVSIEGVNHTCLLSGGKIKYAFSGQGREDLNLFRVQLRFVTLDIDLT